MSEQLKRIENALENGDLTKDQIDLLIELHNVCDYDLLLELLQDQLISIVSRNDEDAFRKLATNERRHQLHDIFHVLTRLAVVST